MTDECDKNRTKNPNNNSNLRTILDGRRKKLTKVKIIK